MTSAVQHHLKTMESAGEHFNHLRRMQEAIDAHIVQQAEVEQSKSVLARIEVEVDFYSKKKAEVMRNLSRLEHENEENKNLINQIEATKKHTMQLEALLEQKKSNFEKQKSAWEERNTPKEEEEEVEEEDHSDAEDAVNDPETCCMVQVALLLGRDMKHYNLMSNHFEQKIEEWKKICPDLAISDAEEEDGSSGFESQGDTGHHDDDTVCDSEQMERDFQSLFGSKSPTRKSQGILGATTSPHKHSSKTRAPPETGKQPRRKKEIVDGESQTIQKGWKAKFEFLPLKLAINSISCQTDELDIELPTIVIGNPLDATSEGVGYVSDEPAVEPSESLDISIQDQTIDSPEDVPPNLSPQMSVNTRNITVEKKLLLTPELVNQKIESESKKLLISLSKNNKVGADLCNSVGGKSSKDLDSSAKNVLTAVFNSKSQVDSPAKSKDKTNKSTKKKKSLKRKSTKRKSTFKSNMSCMSSIICTKKGTWKHSWHLSARKSRLKMPKVLRQEESSDSESEVHIGTSPKDLIGNFGSSKEIEQEMFCNTPKSKQKKASRKSISKPKKNKNAQKKGAATFKTVSEPLQPTRRSARLSIKSASKAAVKKAATIVEEATVELRDLRPSRNINYGSPTESIVNTSAESPNIESMSRPRNPPPRRSASLSTVKATLTQENVKTSKGISPGKPISSSKSEVNTQQLELSDRTLRMKLRSRRRNSISSIVEAKTIMQEKMVVQDDQIAFKTPAASKSSKTRPSRARRNSTSSIVEPKAIEEDQIAFKTPAASKSSKKRPNRARRNSTSSIVEPKAMENDQMAFKKPAAKTMQMNIPTGNSKIVKPKAVQGDEMVFKKPADKMPQKVRTSRKLAAGTVEPIEMPENQMVNTATQTTKLASTRNSSSSKVEAIAVQTDQMVLKKPANKIQTNQRSPRNSLSSNIEPETVQTDQVVFKNPANKIQTNQRSPRNSLSSNIESETVQTDQVVFKKPANKMQMNQRSPRNSLSSNIEPEIVAKDQVVFKKPATKMQTNLASTRNPTSNNVEPKTLQNDHLSFKKPEKKTQPKLAPPRNSVSKTAEPKTTQKGDKNTPKTWPQSPFKMRLRSRRNSISSIIEIQEMQKNDQTMLPTQNKTSKAKKTRRNSICSIVEALALNAKKSLQTSNGFGSQNDLKNCGTLGKSVDNTVKSKTTYKNAASKERDEQRGSKETGKNLTNVNDEVVKTRKKDVQKSQPSKSNAKSSQIPDSPIRKSDAKVSQPPAKPIVAPVCKFITTPKTRHKPPPDFDSTKELQRKKSSRRQSVLCVETMSHWTDDNFEAEADMSIVSRSSVTIALRDRVLYGNSQPMMYQPNMNGFCNQFQYFNPYMYMYPQGFPMPAQPQLVVPAPTVEPVQDDSVSSKSSSEHHSPEKATMKDLRIVLQDCNLEKKRKAIETSESEEEITQQDQVPKSRESEQCQSALMSHEIDVESIQPAELMEMQTKPSKNLASDPKTTAGVKSQPVAKKKTKKVAKSKKQKYVPPSDESDVESLEMTTQSKFHNIKPPKYPARAVVNLQSGAKKVPKCQEPDLSESDVESLEKATQSKVHNIQPPKNPARAVVNLQSGAKKVPKSQEPDLSESDVSLEKATQSKVHNIQPPKNPARAVVNLQSGAKKVPKSQEPDLSESDLEPPELAGQSKYQNVQPKAATVSLKNPAVALKITTERKLKQKKKKTPKSQQQESALSDIKNQCDLAKNQNLQHKKVTMPSKNPAPTRKTSSNSKLQAGAKKKQEEPIEFDLVVTQADVHSSLEGPQFDTNKTHSKSATPQPEKITSTVKNTYPALYAIEPIKIPIPDVYTRSARKVKPTYKYAKFVTNVTDKKPKRKSVKNPASKTKIKEPTAVKPLEQCEKKTEPISSAVDRENYLLSNVWSQEVDSIFMADKPTNLGQREKRKLTHEEKKAKKIRKTEKKGTERKEKNPENHLEAKKVALSKDVAKEKPEKDKKVFKVPSEYHRQLVKKRYPNNVELKMREECVTKNLLLQKRIHLSDSDESVSLKYSGKRRRRSRLLSEGSSDSSYEQMEKRLQELVKEGSPRQSPVVKFRRIQVAPRDSDTESHPSYSQLNCLMNGRASQGNPEQNNAVASRPTAGNAVTPWLTAGYAVPTRPIARNTEDQQQKSKTDDESSDSNPLVIDEVPSSEIASGYEDLKSQGGWGVCHVDLTNNMELLL